jgi:hypothetical protein
MVPERPAVPGLAATVKLVVPGPLPAAPPVTVIQPLLLEAVHPHPAAAVTSIVPLAPVSLTDCDAGEME